MAETRRPELFKPISDPVRRLLCQHDMHAIEKMWSGLGKLPMEERLAALTKMFESSKKPSAPVALLNLEEFDDNDEEEEGHDGELEDEKKPAIGELHQVPGEGERECKKPRLADGSECEGLEA